MSRKRKDAWQNLKDQMSNKRTKNNNKDRPKGSAPHELIVQRVSSEPDHGG